MHNLLRGKRSYPGNPVKDRFVCSVLRSARGHFESGGYNAHIQGGLRMARDDKGATVIEYGLIVSLVSVVIIIVLQAIGDNLSAAFAAVSSALGVR